MQKELERVIRHSLNGHLLPFMANSLAKRIARAIIDSGLIKEEKKVRKPRDDSSS